MGHYLNFQCYCSKQRKVESINTLYQWAYHTRSPEFLNNEIKNIEEILKKKWYSEAFNKNLIIKSQNLEDWIF